MFIAMFFTFDYSYFYDWIHFDVWSIVSYLIEKYHNYYDEEHWYNLVACICLKNTVTQIPHAITFFVLISVIVFASFSIQRQWFALVQSSLNVTFVHVISSWFATNCYVIKAIGLIWWRQQLVDSPAIFYFIASPTF